MRKILCVLFLLAAFCMVSSGGCGGSDSDSSSSPSIPSPADWSELSGTWKPVDGYVAYYNAAGDQIEVCKLDTSSSTNAEVKIDGAGELYNVTFNAGSISFKHSSGENEHATVSNNYSAYDGTDYRKTDGQLSESVTKSSRTLTKTIKFVNNDSVNAIFTRTENNTKTMNADVTFERVTD